MLSTSCLQARITLARAVYSTANILLLDDILSALDVHTSRWIVDQCLAGDLLRGRTVLLVTHNVQLAQTVSDYIVLLRLDGTIQSCGPAVEVIGREKVLQEAITEEEAHELEIKLEEVMNIDGPKQAKGKLIVAEEVALGHVGWPACMSFFRSATTG